jgi:lysophospholipase L1-like esterase
LAHSNRSPRLMSLNIWFKNLNSRENSRIISFEFGKFMKKKFSFILLFLIGCVSSFSQTIAEKTSDCQEAKDKNARYEKHLSDWAQLGRYRNANLSIQSPSKNEMRVVFMGDSITDGWNLAQYFPGKPYINRGISGQTTPQMLLRFRADVIDLKPKVVVILAGTNDIAGNTGLMTLEDTERNLISMVELAKANNIRVVLSSVLPVNDRAKNKEGVLLVQTRSRPNEKITAMNDWLKKYAADNRLAYLDYYSATVDKTGTLKDGISYDGLHPNADGYKIMQSLAEKAIERAMKQ